ncbi:MAG: ComF family protein [Desulfobaccales bacterium]
MLAEFCINPGIRLKRLGLTVLEFFLPRLCLFCEAAVGEEAAVAVCPECAAQIQWVASPLCTCCGRMFAEPGGPDRVCGDCQTDSPPFTRARAAAIYDHDGPVAAAITRFKFGRRMAFLPVMQSWLQRPLCRELVANADLLVPVPLHPKRIKHRGFNQVLLLAQAFPEAALAREAVVRTRHTAPQVGLNPKERRDNVKGAFAVPDPGLVKGKSVLLIDDLLTTGSTVKECARVLRRAGARQVEVLTVARVRYD